MTTTRDPPQTTRELAAASVSSTLDRRPGEILGEKYLLLRPLGAGGMGQVWVARNLATQAEVAAKVLLPERAVVGDALERFRREAQATASLWHRGIVRAFDLVELDRAKGSLLLVMELLHGQTLAQRLEQCGKLTVTETLRILVPILSALDHAHRAGLVHRDLKPDNVFLTVEPDGEVIPKLVDFGISKMRHASAAITQRGALVGTPYYMSPEQARGDAVDGRSDVFAVGILLYECLSGASPFDGATVHDVVRAVLEHDPPPLDGVPPGVRAVVARALAKRADDRYAGATELADALVQAFPDARATTPLAPPAAPGPPSLTSVPPAVSRTTAGQRPVRSRGAVVAVGVLGLAALFVGLGVGSLRRQTDAAAALSAPRVLVPERISSVSKRLTFGRDVVLPSDVRAPPEVTPEAHVHHSVVPAPRVQVPAAPTEVPTADAPSKDRVLRDPGF